VTTPAGSHTRFPVPARAAVRAAAQGLLPVALAVLVCALVLACTGHDPLVFYQLLVREAFGGADQIGATLASATPLLFTGLATAISFRAGVFNLGVEGGFVLGGLTTATVAAHLGALPGPLAAAVALLAGTMVGVAFGALPAALRARWGVDEVVVTLMLNFVATGLAIWLVTSWLQAPGVANAATPMIPREAWLPHPLSPAGLASGFAIGLLLVIGYGVGARRSVFGYELRQTGLNPRFAMAQGIEVSRVVFVAMLVSGAVAGLGGGAHALGVVHRFVDGFSPGYGFTGIAVALLGRNSAVGIVAGALFFGAMSSAGTTIQLFDDIPVDIVDVLTGTVMIFAVTRLAGALRRRPR
jgi:general nucleoside transport system permease protein